MATTIRPSAQYENSAAEETSPIISSHNGREDPDLSADEPTSQEISERAYQLWEEGGRKHGAHESDWERAEQDLRALKAQSRHKPKATSGIGS